MNERDIFISALEKGDPAERSAFVREACGDDQAKRLQIEALLKESDALGSFLEPPTPAEGATIGWSDVVERPGTVIGPYKLLQQIGEGGMGTVYMAEQTEPVQRKVALKLIKAGLESLHVIARFEAERQALALMDHPNIARVLDAGTTAGGRPYFVMELVKGLPITKYCDQRHLSTRQRLDLFVPVCQAVQHAHQKGIIHRDLKPSNIMVCLYDGKPVPKVIDFGIAKATSTRLTDRTLFTEFGAVVGTFEYMSPEQAELDQLDIDTRSDIYSLGVLLYELLTGSTPLERGRLKEAALLEVLRLIREEEPPKPSSRLSTTDGLPSIAANRACEPKKLGGLVRGELDWIAMKALDKDRNRRYETANGLAQDIERHLHNEPVQACTPSAMYRLRKFTRRNRVAITTAAILSAMLVLGTAVSSWQAIRATRAEGLARKLLQAETKARNEAVAARNDEAEQRIIADRERVEAELQRRHAETNFKQALDAVDQMLTQVGQEDLASLPHMERVRRDLLLRALQFYEQFLHQRSNDPVVRSEIGMAYRRVAEIQHKLGQDAQAELAHGQAVDQLERLATEFPDSPEHRLELSRSLHSQGAFLTYGDRIDEALTVLQRALSLQKKLVSEHPESSDYRQELARSHSKLGACWGKTGNVLEVQEATDHAIRLQEELASEFPAKPEYRRDLAKFLCNRATMHGRAGRFQEAETTFRQVIAIQQKLVIDDPAERDDEQILTAAYTNLGSMLWQSNRLEDAEDAFRRALSLIEKLAADFPSVPTYQSTLGGIYSNLGTLSWITGRETEATKFHQQAIDIHEKLVDEYPAVPDFESALGGALHNFASLLQKKPSTLEQARELYERAIGHQQFAVERNPRNPIYRNFLLNHYENMAFTLQALGRHAEAEQNYRRNLAYETAQIAESPNVPDYQSHLGCTLHNLGELLLDQNQLAEARALLEQSVGHQQAALKINPKNSEYRRFLRNHNLILGSVLVKLAEPDAAEDAYRCALSLDQELADAAPNAPEFLSNLGATCNDLAMVLRDKNRLPQARQLLEQAITNQQAALKISPQSLRFRQFLRNHYLNVADILLRQQEHSEAARVAAEMVRVEADEASDSFNAACFLARCVPLARSDTRLTQVAQQAAAAGYADQAVELLDRAAASGWSDFDYMKLDADLDSIREHPGYKKLIEKP